MRRLLLFLFVCCRANSSLANEDYIRYQRMLHRADVYIYQQQPASAQLVMDSVLQEYSFVYARHCVKGLQLALQLQDDPRAEAWLQRCLLQGVPLWMLRNNGITAGLWNRPFAAQVIGHADSFYSVYLSCIDTNLRKRVAKMTEKDARRTRRVNNGIVPLRYTVYALSWWRHNRRQAREIASVIRRYGYPGERLIGLPPMLEDSLKTAAFMQKEGINIVLQQREALFMLLHYFSTRRMDMNELLYPEIAKGNLPPMQYARINDYLSINTSDKRYPSYGVHDPGQGKQMDSVDQRRAAIGIYPVEWQLQLQERHKQLRKSNRIESEIIFDTGT